VNPLAIISTLLLKLPPNVRLALYAIGFGIALLAPWLTSHGWITVVDSETLTRVAGILTGGMAGLVLGGQKRDGTLDFSGSTADQAIAYTKATVNKAVTAATAASDAAADLERVKTAITGAVKDAPVLGPVLGPWTEQAMNALPLPQNR
jgi:hypothetical protein